MGSRLVRGNSNYKDGRLKIAVVQGIYGLVIYGLKYKTVSTMVYVTEADVIKISSGKIHRKTYLKYSRLADLKLEVKRRNKYFKNFLVSDYIYRRIEKMWLDGNGRGKIIKSTGFSYNTVRRVISELIIKHNKCRADLVEREISNA